MKCNSICEEGLMNEFIKLYEKYFKDDCPPSEQGKKKQDGCFHALNDYGKEPKIENCFACWINYLREMMEELP